MANATRRVVVGLIAVGLLATARAAGADEKAATPRIRSNPGIAALIAQATQQSKTFRGLVDHIENSDAIVYIEQGDCGHGVKACLANISTAGKNRILWIRVDSHKSGLNLIVSIGHELRHAVEVIDEPMVRKQGDMIFFYRQVGRRGSGTGAIETNAAVDAGLTIRAELRKAETRRAANSN